VCKIGVRNEPRQMQLGVKSCETDLVSKMYIYILEQIEKIPNFVNNFSFGSKTVTVSFAICKLQYEFFFRKELKIRRCNAIRNWKRLKRSFWIMKVESSGVWRK
jgi:hypothetical protein